MTTIESPILAAREAMLAAGALRSDSKMRNLTEDHFEQVCAWLLEPLTAKKIIKLCELELRLPAAKVPGATALWSFWQSFGPYWMQAKRRIAGEQARLAGAEASASPVDWDRANADAIKQLTFELLRTPNFDPKTVKPFVMATLKLRDQDHVVRKMELLEAKMAEAKAALTKVEQTGGLSAEALEKIRHAAGLL